MLNIYITSTQKKEGKTLLTAGLAATMQSLGYTTSVYKPIQTSGIDINGFTQSPDLTFVKSIDPYINTYHSYIFKSHFEPLIASETENEYIDLDFLNKEYSKILKTSDCTILDGDSGILSPLAPNLQTIDFVRKIQVPMIYTVQPREGAINDILLSIYAALDKGVDIRGVIINNIKNDCSKELLTSMTRVIEEYSNVQIIGLLPYIDGKILPEELITAILNGIDIESIFNVKIEKLDF